jgi:hypothetical protein
MISENTNICDIKVYINFVILKIEFYADALIFSIAFHKFIDTLFRFSANRNSTNSENFSKAITSE